MVATVERFHRHGVVVVLNCFFLFFFIILGVGFRNKN